MFGGVYFGSSYPAGMNFVFITDAVPLGTYYYVILMQGQIQ